MNIVKTSGLGRRYRSRWALRDCSLEIPEGSLAALVGPNGSGKSTLLNLLVGLTKPTTGTVAVLGDAPAGSLVALDAIAFVAQDAPLYRSLSVREMCRMTQSLNGQFDAAYAWRRMDDLGIDEKQKTGRLSGGQQAQLALTLALARHPRLLILDEPTASLDPIARHDFMATVVTAMADDGISVILSSHILADLERVADFLVLIGDGRVHLAEPVDNLVASHRLVTSPASIQFDEAGVNVVETTTAGSQTHRLVRLARPDTWCTPPDSVDRSVGIEELALAYLRQTYSTRGGLTLAGTPE